MGNKLLQIYNYVFPCHEINDRRENRNKYKGLERRIDDCMNSNELKRALNNKFDALATTITNAKEIHKR